MKKEEEKVANKKEAPVDDQKDKSVKTENKTNSEETKKDEDKEQKTASAKSSGKPKKKVKKVKKEDITEELGKKLEEINDKYLRLTAEFDNFRKRTLKEKMELAKTAGESILVNVLPVMDDFERAKQSIDSAKDINAIKEGIDLIFNKFSEFLAHNGVKEIEAKDCDFDTDIHEAVTKFPAQTEEQKGKVIDVVQKGYTLNDKVIRFSKVVVGE